MNQNYAQELRQNGYLLLEEPPLLRNHLAAAYAAWSDFFASPSKFSVPGSVSVPSGYIPICLPTGCDLKESFYYSPGVNLPANVKEPTLRIVKALEEIAVQISESMVTGDSSPLIQNPRWGCLRVMRYPAFQGAQESPLMRALASSGSVRAIEHTDLNSLTLLPSPTAPGLEILESDQNWRLVDETPGKIVVHVGQELEQRSNSRYRATLHRVRNSQRQEETLDRLSMSYFVS